MIYSVTCIYIYKVFINNVCIIYIYLYNVYVYVYVDVDVDVDVCMYIYNVYTCVSIYMYIYVYVGMILYTHTDPVCIVQCIDAHMYHFTGRFLQSVGCVIPC